MAEQRHTIDNTLRQAQQRLNNGTHLSTNKTHTLAAGTTTIPQGIGCHHNNKGMELQQTDKVACGAVKALHYNLRLVVYKDKAEARCT